MCMDKACLRVALAAGEVTEYFALLLQRLQTDVASQAAGDGGRGKYASKQADVSQGSHMPQSSGVANGSTSHRGTRTYAVQSAKRS